MTLTSQVKRETVWAGDVMRVDFKARNHSTAVVQKVRSTLYERIRWKARGRTKVHVRVVQEEVCPGTSLADLQALTQAPPSALLLSSSMSSPDCRYGPLESSEEETAAKRNPEACLKHQDCRVVFLDIPPHIRSHLKGNHIAMDHFPKVQLVTGMCLSTPENICPIIIQSTPPPPPPTYQPPTTATALAMIPTYDETEISEALFGM